MANIEHFLFDPLMQSIYALGPAAHILVCIYQANYLCIVINYYLAITYSIQ